MYTQKKGQEESPHSFSRRALLGGMAALLGAGMAGCSLLPGQTQPSSSGSVSPAATHPLPPTPTPSPTPAPLGTTLYTYHGHSFLVNAVAWSPNGQRVASGSSSTDGTVQICDALTGANVVTHRRYGDSGATVTWAPDGQQLASGDTKVLYGPDMVQVWNAANGQVIRVFSPHTHSPAPGPVNGLSWSPDGKSLASASYDYTVRVWDVATGNIRFFYSDPNGYLMTCVTWSPDSQYIAFGNDDNGTGNVMVQVWHVASQSRVAVYRGHTKPIEAVAWSPNGQYVASTGIDQTVQVWRATTASHLLTYTGHVVHSGLSSAVLSVDWSPDSKRIASAGYDTTVQIWESLSGTQIYTYRGHSGAVYAAIWSPDGAYIASGGDDTTVQVWKAV